MTGFDIHTIIKYKVNYYLVSYYTVLLIIGLSWTNQAQVEPNILHRISYTVAFFVPLLFYRNIAPAIITLFVSLRLFSIAPYGYLPSDTIVYLGMMILILLFGYISDKPYQKLNSFLVILLLVSIFSNLVNYVTKSIEYEFQKSLIIVLILLKLIHDKKDLELLKFAFILITVCLSLYGILFSKELIEVSLAGNLKRIFWQDPNYLGCLIGIGLIISLHSLLFKKHTILIKILLGSTLLIGMINIAYFASRGAFITITLPALYLVFKRTRKLRHLLPAFVSIILVVLAINYFSIFDALISRFVEEETLASGSDRTTAWAGSFRIFIESDFWTFLIGGGGGYSDILCGKAFNVNLMSAHNNFLEILYNYGLVGLSLFIALIVSWVKRYWEEPLPFALLLVFILTCMTLSPLMYLPFWFLILLIERMELNRNEEEG